MKFQLENFLHTIGTKNSSSCAFLCEKLNMMKNEIQKGKEVNKKENSSKGASFRISN